MSKKDFWLFGSLFLIIFLFGGFLVFKIFGNQALVEVVVSNVAPEQEEQILNTQKVTKCSETPKLYLQDSQSLEIQKLSFYQEICDSFVTNQLMYFGSIPTDETLERILHKDLRMFAEFKKYGIKPIVVLEPYTANGVMKWTDISGGMYDGALDRYLEALNQAGFVASDFALIVPLPEPNVPNWTIDNQNPEEFSKAYSKIALKYKEKFSNIELGLLLNSQTYDADDVNWENGIYDYYDAYLLNIPANVVDVLVMQGFPWVSGAGKRKIEITDPNVFLGVDLVPRTLHKLKIKKVWFNTGTFSVKYANDSVNKVEVPNSTRKKVLLDIANVANDLANQGYEVSINLFAQNKSLTKEGTDWSYSNPDQKLLIRDFVGDLTQKGIGFSLFDL